MTKTLQRPLCGSRVYVTLCIEYIYSSTNLSFLYYTSVFPFFATIYVYSTTFQREIFYPTTLVLHSEAYFKYRRSIRKMDFCRKIAHVQLAGLLILKHQYISSILL